MIIQLIGPEKDQQQFLTKVFNAYKETATSDENQLIIKIDKEDIIVKKTGSLANNNIPDFTKTDAVITIKSNNNSQTDIKAPENIVNYLYKPDLPAEIQLLQVLAQVRQSMKLKPTFNKINAKALQNAFNLAQQSFQEKDVRNVCEKRKPKYITNENAINKLLDFLQGEGASHLQSYKYKVVQILFSLPEDTNAEAEQKIISLISDIDHFISTRSPDAQLLLLLQQPTGENRRFLDAIESGANPKLTCPLTGDTVLHRLIRNVQSSVYIEEIESLLKHNSDIQIDAKNYARETPLKLLLNKTANDKNELHTYINFAMQLIRKGANPKTKSTNGNTLMHILGVTASVFEGDDMTSLIAELAKKDNTIFLVSNNKGITPLISATTSLDFYNNDFEKKINVILALIKNGANVNEIDRGNSDKTLLHKLVRFDNSAILTDEDKSSIEKHKASTEKKRSEIMSAIIKLPNNVDANLTDNTDKNPLSYVLDRIANYINRNVANSNYEDQILASISFNVKLAIYLINNLKFNPKTKSDSGHTLMHLLICIKTYDDQIKSLAATDLTLFEVKNKGLTPFALALRQTFLNHPILDWQLDRVLLLVRSGANVNEPVYFINNSTNWTTFLHELTANFMSCNNIVAIITELVDKHGANPDIQNTPEKTPLAIALNTLASSNTSQKELLIEVAMTLIRKGANVNTESDQYQTLLHLLAKDQIDRSALIKELLTNHRANYTIKNINGHTPLEQAKKSRHAISVNNTDILEAFEKNPNTHTFCFEPITLSSSAKIGFENNTLIPKAPVTSSTLHQELHEYQNQLL